MLMLVLVSVLTAVRADCDACVEGRCYTRKTLARELFIPDQMAIDRKNGILYVHTDSDMNTAFLHDDLTIQLVRRQNYTGLAVDQDTQILYTSDNKNFYKYSQDSLNTTFKITLSNQGSYAPPKMLFYKDCLTYAEKSRMGIFYINPNNNESWTYWAAFKKYAISDLVIQVGCIKTKMYFVANDTTYYFSTDGQVESLVVADAKKFVLSADKYNNAYFGDSTLNVIYKMDKKTNKLVEYAAYESGSVDKFVFDNNNNVVFYDASEGSFSIWKPDLLNSNGCTIEAPHSKYQINLKPNIEQNCCT